MSAATVITSSMPNVPVLSGTEGSLAALIRYIAPILGWEIMFDNGPVIVVRPQSYKGGQALLYRFDDRAARGGYAPRVAEVRAYESMSDINTGAGLVGPTYVHKSYYASTASRKYFIIGDAYGFIIGTDFLYVNYNAAYTLQYFGFLNQMGFVGEIPLCACLGAPDSNMPSNIFVANSPSASGDSGLKIHKNMAGTINVSIAVVNGGGALQIPGGAIGTPNVSSSVILPLPAYPYKGSCLYAPVYTNDGSQATIGSRMPGAYGWYHSTVPPASDLSMAPSAITKMSVGDKNFVAINHQSGLGSNYNGWIIVDTGEGFRP